MEADGFKGAPLPLRGSSFDGNAIIPRQEWDWFIAATP